MDEYLSSSRQQESLEHFLQENMMATVNIEESSCSISNSGNDCFTQEVDISEEDNRPYMIRWKSGKRVDPRLLTLLESFRELYVHQRELFKEIFPEIYDEFVDVFKKIGMTIWGNKEIKYGSLERSLSLGSSRGLEQTEEESVMRLQKFKVKSPKVIVAGSDGKGGSK